MQLKDYTVSLSRKGMSAPLKELKLLPCMLAILGASRYSTIARSSEAYVTYCKGLTPPRKIHDDSLVLLQ